MGMCKIVSMEELKRGNKRMCLSPLRFLDKCDECEIMQRYYIDQTRKEPKGVKPCESAVFSKERLQYLEKKKGFKDQIKALELKLKNLEDQQNE